MTTIAEILKDSSYKLGQFRREQIKALETAITQIVFKWSQDGSNHPRFDEKELLRLPVPRELLQNSGEYVTALQSVIAKRERAAQLLDAAKRAVEIAIEDSEAAALAFLNTPCSGALAYD